MKKMKIVVISGALIALIASTGFAAGKTQAASTGPTKVTVQGFSKPADTLAFWKVMQRELAAKNIELEFVDIPSDVYPILLSSGGDLPDIASVGDSTISAVLENGQALDLDPILKDYLPSALNPLYTAAAELTRQYYGGKDHKLYILPMWVGVAGAGGGTGQSRGYIVRWDYYKEIGAPPINNDDDYFAALKAMQALHPTTKTGKKTYAIGVEKNFTDMGGYRASFLTSIAVNPWSFTGTRYATGFADNKLVNGYTDLSRSHYWTDMKFYNRIWREGLFDPDSYTMSYDEYKIKIADGAYMGLYFRSDSLYNAEFLQDPNTMADYVIVPSEGTVLYSDNLELAGQLPSAYFIPKTSKNWQAAAAVLNMIFDPDFVRIIYSGERGTYWDYDANGKAVVLDAAFEDMKDNTLWSGLFSSATFCGYNPTTTHPDGSRMRVWGDDEYKYLSLNAVNKDVADFYGVKWPAAAFVNLVQQGKTVDASQDYGNIIARMIRGNISSDMKRIITASNDILERAMPRLIQATTDDEFTKIQQEVLANLKAAGEQQVWDWLSKEYDAQAKIIGPIFNAARPTFFK